MAPLVRSSRLIPGYDCGTSPCGVNGCGSRPGSGHGIGPEMWIYIVSDGEVCLSFHVSSGRYPPAVKNRHAGEEKMDVHSLYIHSSFPMDVDELTRPLPEVCEWLEVPCWTDPWSMSHAKDLGERAGISHQFEQSEQFWSVLEDESFMRMLRVHERGASTSRTPDAATATARDPQNDDHQTQIHVLASGGGRTSPHSSR